MEHKTIMAIDPDIEKNGVATVDTKERTIGVEKVSFTELVFGRLQTLDKDETLVVIEGGWLNEKSAFHRYPNARVASYIGKSVGRNHETGRKIAECCEYLGLDVKIIKPLVKRWKGTDGKITQEELESVCKSYGYTLSKKRMNQDERDACLIAVAWSGKNR